MATPSRKRKILSVEDKLRIIDRLILGEKAANLSREYGIPKSSISMFKGKEKGLREFVHKCSQQDGLKRKKMRQANDGDLDQAVYLWFEQQRAANIPISGPMVMEKAIALSKEMHGEDRKFTGSTGWLYRWKNRHGIRALKISGEDKSCDDAAAAEFIPELRNIIESEGYSPDQIYNADETGLFFKCLPDRTLASRKEEQRTTGYKKYKDRVTILVGTNASGEHKLRPLCIGKFQNPRCLKHVNRETPPISYCHTYNAWMTSDIFKKWFHEEFVPSVRSFLRRRGLEQKAILLIDNCPAHPAETQLRTRDGKIRAYFLPKNTTSKIQPMDAGIISALKKRYRKKLLREIVSRDVTALQDFLKTLDIASVRETTLQCDIEVTLMTPMNHKKFQQHLM
uniref:jerky protein homolog-like n=1 Tax=Myxine glutinosa TaxID=7769 RepID=UPI00358E07B1